MSAKKLMTMAEYAAHQGISVPRVSRLIKSGKMDGCFTREGKRLMFDVAASDKALAERTERTRGPKAIPTPANRKPGTAEKKAVSHAAGTAGMTLFEAQTEDARYRAALRKLDYEQRTREVVSRAEVMKDATDLGRATRDALLNLPDQLAERIAAETSPDVVNSVLTEAITQALEGLVYDGQAL